MGSTNQVFQWRRLYRDGKLGAIPQNAMKLLPVSIEDDEEPAKPQSVEAAHVRHPGRDPDPRPGGKRDHDRTVSRVILEMPTTFLVDT
jgi:hypothetical protein